MKLTIICLSISLAVCLFLAVVFFLKYRLLKGSVERITKRLGFVAENETNLCLDIEYNSKAIRQLTKKLNAQILSLQKARYDFNIKDKELKEAILNMSHDLRTPLTVIIGYTDKLLKTETKAQNDLLILKEKAYYMKDLIEELFSYSAAVSEDKPIEKERLSLNCLIEEAVAQFYTEITEKGIVPKISLPDVEVIRTLNKSFVCRIFDNIIANALRHGGEDLEIVLSDKGEIRFKNHAKDLDSVSVGKLFDRFFTVNNAKHYSGLGLSIAKHLTEVLGGSIASSYNDGQLSIILTF